MEKEKLNSINTINLTDKDSCPYEDRKCKCGAVIKPRWVFDVWFEAQEICSECIEKEDEERKLRDVFDLSGLKTRHENMEIDNYKPSTALQREAAERLRKYDKESLRNIFISGAVGTGKTHLIVGLVKKIARERLCWFKFRTGVDMLYEIRSTFNYGDPGETDRMIAKFTKTDILVIDDLGAEKSTEWARETFYMIIDRRYNMMKRTFITSNLSPKELAGKLNDRLVSRLIEGAMILKLDGKDYRLSK